MLAILEDPNVNPRKLTIQKLKECKLPAPIWNLITTAADSPSVQQSHLASAKFIIIKLREEYSIDVGHGIDCTPQRITCYECGKAMRTAALLAEHAEKHRKTKAKLMRAKRAKQPKRKRGRRNA